MEGLNTIETVLIPIGDHAASTYLGAAGQYPRTFWLEKGYEWEVIDLRILAATTYSPVAACYSFILEDASGDTICTVNNAATTIAANPATGIDASPVAAQKYIDTKSAGTFLQLVPTQSGAGKAYIGLQAVVRLYKHRPA